MEKLTKEILQNSKWRVTPEQSKILQEAAFKLGYTWSNDLVPKMIVDDGHKCLYFYSRTNIIFCDDGSYFESKEYPNERKFEDYFEPITYGVAPGFKVKKAHKEGDVTVLDDIELKEFSIINDIEQKMKDIAAKPLIEGTFMWAVEQMKQGKKVRRKFYPIENKIYWHFLGKAFALRRHCGDYNSTDLCLNHSDYIATDWEIYEENKSLSDKIINHHSLLCCDQASIQRAVRKLKNDFSDSSEVFFEGTKVIRVSDIDKIFGDRLQ